MALTIPPDTYEFVQPPPIGQYDADLYGENTDGPPASTYNQYSYFERTFPRDFLSSRRSGVAADILRLYRYRTSRNSLPEFWAVLGRPLWVWDASQNWGGRSESIIGRFRIWESFGANRTRVTTTAIEDEQIAAVVNSITFHYRLEGRDPLRSSLSESQARDLTQLLGIQVVAGDTLNIVLMAARASPATTRANLLATSIMNVLNVIRNAADGGGSGWQTALETAKSWLETGQSQRAAMLEATQVYNPGYSGGQVTDAELGIITATTTTTGLLFPLTLPAGQRAAGIRCLSAWLAWGAPDAATLANRLEFARTNNPFRLSSWRSQRPAGETPTPGVVAPPDEEGRTPYSPIAITHGTWNVAGFDTPFGMATDTAAGITRVYFNASEVLPVGGRWPLRCVDGRIRRLHTHGRRRQHVDHLTILRSRQPERSRRRPRHRTHHLRVNHSHRRGSHLLPRRHEPEDTSVRERRPRRRRSYSHPVRLHRPGRRGGRRPGRPVPPRVHSHNRGRSVHVLRLTNSSNHWCRPGDETLVDDHRQIPPTSR